jgi:hypothetical protein
VAEYRAHYAAENTHDIPPSLVAASLIVPALSLLLCRSNENAAI